MNLTHHSNNFLPRAFRILCVLSSLLYAASAFGDIIPASRLTNWQGNVGVPGGIPTRTTIYTTLPASSDHTAIENAINSCPSGQVVQLAAGTFNLTDQIRIYSANNWTVRGAGAGKTILKGGGNSIFAIGRTPWLTEWPGTHPITAGATAGSTSITLATAPTGINNNELMVIEQPNTGGIFGYGSGSSGAATTYTDDRMNDNSAVLNYRVYVTAINGNTITFSPALPFAFTGAPRAVGFAGIVGPKNSGLEELTVSGSSTNQGISVSGAYGFWLKNVEVTGWSTLGLNILWSTNCEVRGCYFHEPATYGWTRGYATQCDAINNCLFEDNIWWHNQAAHFLQGCCSANVISYNVCYQAYNVYTGTTWMGPSYEGNHAPYPLLNLYEGNYGNGFQTDYYYGPSAKYTLLRNYYTGSDPDITQHRIVVSIDSHSWNYNVVGNILGSTATGSALRIALPNLTVPFVNTASQSWTYDSGTRNFSDGENVIFRLGYPFIGNNSSTGSANPPDTSSQLSYIDLSVKAGGANATLIHGNWDKANNAQTWDSSIADHAIPSSYYLSGKPAFFGSLAWPAYDPSNPSAASITSIPAGYRLVNGTSPAPGGAVTPPSNAKTAISKQ